MYILLFIFLTFGGESETQIITVDSSGTRQDMGKIEHYMSSIKKLSRQYPDHNIELQLEINKSVTKLPSKFRRSNVQYMKVPKRLLRNGNSSNGTTTLGSSSLTTTPTTHGAQVRQSDDSEKAPIYLDDLKKALEDFEKRLASHSSNCNGNHDNAETTESSTTDHVSHSVSPSPKQNRSIQDILQLIRKGVKVEYHVPKPTDDSLEWLQIKFPN